MGVDEVLMKCLDRLFFLSDLCGALAISFVHHALFRSQLPTCREEASYVHEKLRHKFHEAIAAAQIAMRPWKWGSGDVEESESEAEFTTLPEIGLGASSQSVHPLVEQFEGWAPPSSHTCISLDDRIDMFSVHGKAMCDDEIRFHLHTLAHRYRQRGLFQDEPAHGILVCLST